MNRAESTRRNLVTWLLNTELAHHKSLELRYAATPAATSTTAKTKTATTAIAKTKTATTKTTAIETTFAATPTIRKEEEYLAQKSLPMRRKQQHQLPESSFETMVSLSDDSFEESQTAI